MLFDRIKAKLFSAYLAWQCRPSRLLGHLKNKLPLSPLAPEPDGSVVKAAALQVELKLFSNPLHFADEVHRRVKEAAEAGAQLIVFPEYHNLPLFGLLPGIDKMEETMAGQNKEDDAETADQISLVDIFHFMSPAVSPFIQTLFSALAKTYGLHIMAGSYTLASGNQVVNRAFLFGPQGQLIGCQDKVHLLPMEAQWQLKRGSSLHHYDTPLGRLAMPVCMDATYYETFRILEQHEVDIALLPIANLEQYNYWLALRGIWPRVQESVIYGVKSALVGSLAGFTFTGKAGIFAPLELTPAGDGILAEAACHDCEAMALADLDLSALHELRINHPWRDTNPTLQPPYPR